MVLLLAVLSGLLASAIRARIYRRTLIIRELKLAWLLVIAMVPQIIAFQIPFTARAMPDWAIPPIQIFSMIGLLVFAVANLRAPGFWALMVGLLLNLVVIAANGGWMPITIETLKRMKPSVSESVLVLGSRAGYSKDMILALDNTRLAILSDRIVTPQWFPLHSAFSIGDVFISLGAFLFIWSLSDPQGEKC